MRLAIAIVGGVSLGLLGAVVALPSLDATCVSPDTRLVDVVCPPSAVALRSANLRREALATQRTETRQAQFPADADGGRGTAAATVRTRTAELLQLQQRAAARSANDPARAQELREIGQRISELRALPYGGQAAADEALSTMSMVTPELANDPMLRAGLRLGGVALDAGQAVDHAVGPQIDKAATRLEGALSKLRPRQ